MGGCKITVAMGDRRGGRLILQFADKMTNSLYQVHVAFYSLVYFLSLHCNILAHVCVCSVSVSLVILLCWKIHQKTMLIISLYFSV